MSFMWEPQPRLWVRIVFTVIVSFFAETLLKNEWKFYGIMFMIFASRLRIQPKFKKYKWLQLHVASKRRIAFLEMDMYTLKSLTISVYQSVCVVCGFFFLNLVFKWWISCAVTLQSDFYHIGMQLRGGLVGKGKRKEELTRLTSQVSTCQLNQYRRVNTVQFTGHSNQAKFLFFIGTCAYKQSYISEPCVLAGSACTCLKHQWGKINRARENEKSKEKEIDRRWSRL